MARGLIEAKERLDAIGKPLLYRVTDEFLDAFQLEDLKKNYRNYHKQKTIMKNYLKENRKWKDYKK